MNQQVTRNQHYVPQCLLKHFAFKVGKSKKINIFDTDRDIVRYNQSIKEVFSQNYFYGTDNRIENFIAKHIESPASRIIDEIVNGNFDSIKKEALTSNRFILSLSDRTPEAIKRADEFINLQFQSIFGELISLNRFAPEKASAGRFNFNDDILASILTTQVVINASLLEDLEYHIIKNETQLEFYISDHPVFIYNWFYRNLDHPQITSITGLGLQIFIPLSPNITLALYDPKVYKYGQRNLVSSIYSNSDIEMLNSFQIINSDGIIGFYLREREACLKRLYARYKGIKLHEYESIVSSNKEENTGEIKSTHFLFRRQAKLKKMPSFIKIKKKYKPYAFSYQERNPALSAKHMELNKLIDEQGRRSIIQLDQSES